MMRMSLEQTLPFHFGSARSQYDLNCETLARFVFTYATGYMIAAKLKFVFGATPSFHQSMFCSHALGSRFSGSTIHGSSGCNPCEGLRPFNTTVLPFTHTSARLRPAARSAASFESSAAPTPSVLSILISGYAFWKRVISAAYRLSPVG